MSFGFGFGFPKRLTSGGGLSPRLYLDFIGTGSLPSTVTFSRGTNATLTDSNGRIAWAPHNLLTNSEDFEAAAWTKVGTASVNANTNIAPDGTLTADTINLPAVGDEVYFGSAGTAGVQFTFSVWLAGSGNITIGVYDNVSGVQDAALITLTSTLTRYTFTFTFGAGSTDRRVYPATRRNNVLNTATSVIVWGAQLNVANAPVNLLTWSQDFNVLASWTPTRTSVLANSVLAPDGTLTADTLTEDGASGEHFVAQQTSKAASSITLTASVYAKRATSSARNIGVAITDGTTGGYAAIFNPSDGSVVLASQAVGTVTGWTAGAATVQDAGNGWWRFIFTATTNTAARADMVTYLVDGTTRVYLGNSTSNAYIWGAQLNTGSVALPYVATTSSINLPPAYNSTTPKNLLGFTQEPENAAWTKSNSYVQQNLLTWSQDFDNAAWTKNFATVTANTFVAPDGTTTADTITEDTATDIHVAFQSVGATALTAHTLSVYIRANTRDFAMLRVGGGTYATGPAIKASLTGAGSTTTLEGPVTSSSITAVGGGWYRVSMVFTTTAATTGYLPQVGPHDNSSSRIYTGNGTGSVFIWGAQLVQGSTAGDYTQTTSAAAPTRYLNWDGTLTGRKLVETTATNTHYAYQTPTLGVGVYTLSVYLKAAERTWALVNVFRGSTFSAYVNLSTGELGFVSGGTATVTNAGNGWWRAAITFTVTVAGASDLGVLTTTGNGTSSYTGDGTSGIYVSDFQLSNSASVDPYVYNPQAAAASAAYYGPRFDYDPVTLAAKGLLIEEQRTNLLTYSEQFDNAGWPKVASSITANSTTAPDGTTTADALIEDATNASHYVTQSVTTTSAAHTLSVYAKASTRSWVYIRIADSGNIARVVWFDVGNGVVGTVGAGMSATIQSVGNGWYRCNTTISSAFAGSQSPRIGVSTADNTETYTGNGTAGIFLWGAQLEAGSFATSYIPTVASQVTRNADSASMLGDNFYTWYNPNQGTYLFDGVQNATNGTQSVYAGTRDTLTGGFNNLTLFYINNTARSIQLTSYDSTGAIQTDINGNTPLLNQGVAKKAAFALQLNNFAQVSDGGTVQTDTTALMPAPAAMSIGRSPAGANYINGYIRRIGYYNTRLPDSTLQALTV